MLEHQVEAYLVERITALGGVCEKVTSPGGRGYFDRVAVLPGGRVLFIEVKRPKGGAVSFHQRLRHQRYAMLGATVVVIKSLPGVDDLVDRLRA